MKSFVVNLVEYEFLVQVSIHPFVILSPCVFRKSNRLHSFVQQTVLEYVERMMTCSLIFVTKE